MHSPSAFLSSCFCFSPCHCCWTEAILLMHPKMEIVGGGEYSGRYSNQKQSRDQERSDSLLHFILLVSFASNRMADQKASCTEKQRRSTCHFTQRLYREKASGGEMGVGGQPGNKGLVVQSQTAVAPQLFGNRFHDIIPFKDLSTWRQKLHCRLSVCHLSTFTWI